jgi:xanthine/CO dehydrogenase XdhC/CoxF family maturation factor
MVIRVDGYTVGIVSGGCLETDLAEHARDVHRSHVAKVVTYDTRADDDAAWGLGLGCNGLIDVFLEPLHPADAQAFAVMLEQAVEGDEVSVVATVIDSTGDISQPQAGSHALITGGTVETIGDWGSRELLATIAKDSRGAFAERRRGLVQEYAGVSVAFQVIEPTIRLVVCGSGPDVVPLVRLGVELGWSIIVADHRPVEHAHAERFPGASVVECAEPRQLGTCVALSDRTAAVVMSHHYARDLDYMRALLASEAGYIGMLGPRARTERMLTDIDASGESGTFGERLYSPVGMDIGGDGPDAIALSIIAEVSAVMSSRSGGHLRDRRGALHEPASTNASVN